MKTLSNLNIETAAANYSGAMEADTMCDERSRTTKNGRNPKNQMSRENTMIILK